MTSLQLDLPLLLPEVPDASDACVDRLRETIRTHRGLGEVHVVPPDGGRRACACTSTPRW